MRKETIKLILKLYLKIINRYDITYALFESLRYSQAVTHI